MFLQTPLRSATFFFFPILFAGLLSCTSSPTFSTITYRIPGPDTLIRLADTISIPAADKGFHLILPAENRPSGLVVFLQADWEGRQSIVPIALGKNLGLLYVSTGNPLEFFLDSAEIRSAVTYLNQAVDTAELHSVPMLFAGMSLAGTRALRLAEYLHANGRESLVPRAVAMCDSPLDMFRFWNSCRRAAEKPAFPVAANEGYWVSSYLENSLGGTPTVSPDAYLRISPFHHPVSSQRAGLINQLSTRTAIRAYTEPNVQWWMEHRGKDYLDMNAVDMVGLVNVLRLKGQPDVELILTVGRGIRPDGSYHPHSWTIVDEAELLDWFIGLGD